MEFNIVHELNGKFDPIVLIKTDEKPREDVISPKPEKCADALCFL